MPRAGGGFGGGGSRGGGFGGGGFGGGFGGGHHHHHHGHGFGHFYLFPWHRPYFGYGGFYGGFLGLFMLPIIIIVIALIFLITSSVSLIGAAAQGGVVQYSESTFRDYSLAEYQKAFGDDIETYENNILVVFSTREGYNEYYTIAQVGNNLKDDIYYDFQEGGAYNVALNRSLLAEDYSDSLDRSLYSVIDSVKKSVKATIVKEGGSPYIIAPDENATVSSSVINKEEAISSSWEWTKKALDEFTAETGISLVLVIDNEEDVFGRTIPAPMLILGIISIGFIIFAIVWIVKAVKAKKEAKNNPDRKPNVDYDDPNVWD